MKRIVLFACCFVFAAPAIFGQGGQERVRIVGRIVDADGKPVANGRITYLPSRYADMKNSLRSGKDGRFELKTGEVGDEGLIWITSNIDYHNWRVLISPGANLIDKYLKRNKPIELKPTEPPNTIDLGDVPVMTYYTAIKVQADPKWTDRVFNSGDDDRVSIFGDMSLRVKDGDGHLADSSVGGRGVNKEESSMVLALPEGGWTIEVKTSKMPWTTIVDKIELTGQPEMMIYFSPDEVRDLPINGQSLEPRHVVDSSVDAACEINNRHIDSLVTRAKEVDERIFIISRRNSSEKNIADKARLSSAVSILTQSKGVNIAKIVTGVGEPVTASKGRLEFYVGSELFLVSLAENGKQVCMTCCP